MNLVPLLIRADGQVVVQGLDVTDGVATLPVTINQTIVEQHVQAPVEVRIVERRIETRTILYTPVAEPDRPLGASQTPQPSTAWVRVPGVSVAVPAGLEGSRLDAWIREQHDLKLARQVPDPYNPQPRSLK